ncbi:uncharacterized protein LOC116297268 [Actinia tenebrosa]|uniref:Uncharacterized protein LOC116297268 n=1 Tax=Actinia tenebrosa TaxID=6105 RepID=A0A6P8I8C1_ACTTE|nr:uncharacterized protein LOC116297268 [Actinia tenebrosa]
MYRVKFVVTITEKSCFGSCSFLSSVDSAQPTSILEEFSSEKSSDEAEESAKSDQTAEERDRQNRKKTRMQEATDSLPDVLKAVKVAAEAHSEVLKKWQSTFDDNDD